MQNLQVTHPEHLRETHTKHTRTLLEPLLTTNPLIYDSFN